MIALAVVFGSAVCVGNRTGRVGCSWLRVFFCVSVIGVRWWYWVSTVN